MHTIELGNQIGTLEVDHGGPVVRVRFKPSAVGYALSAVLTRETADRLGLALLDAQAADEARAAALLRDGE